MFVCVCLCVRVNEEVWTSSSLSPPGMIYLNTPMQTVACPVLVELKTMAVRGCYDTRSSLSASFSLFLSHEAAFFLLASNATGKVLLVNQEARFQRRSKPSSCVVPVPVLTYVLCMCLLRACACAYMYVIPT